jgi:hypothetical protein
MMELCVIWPGILVRIRVSGLIGVRANPFVNSPSHTVSVRRKILEPEPSRGRVKTLKIHTQTSVAFCFQSLQQESQKFRI